MINLQLAPGDFVHFGSGGMTMKVISVFGDTVSCGWVASHTQQYHISSFPRIALVKAAM
jgi:hypothetical protein